VTAEPAHNEHPGRATGEGAENYAKAIYQLQARGEKSVGTGAIAERLGVTPASASAMLRRLAEDGIVEHNPYHGVRLTKRGEQLALEVIRHHRLLELFLAEILEMPWDQVHREAEVLEHYISPELAESIARKLGNPTRDPHGDPIPTPDLKLVEGDTVSLDSMVAGQRDRPGRPAGGDRAPAVRRSARGQGGAEGRVARRRARARDAGRARLGPLASRACPRSPRA
jgi:DtxR family transcriptional regulator, Mn-dependent transcriptional regulator